ncbi:hypothetical protein [Oscillatoria sp. FACHB-1406]|uniref:hypothetical protein n=1 Tax=Oscillatoria sp. FACHB-1406 TaxID=2692846 RepID=UPI0016862AB4|nr:hypothetical protein [Oscillatoria sp. FACHB-1406]MBD2578987.1 hypothetical protein [Oscillatoria sp. FACHB-1406]
MALFEDENSILDVEIGRVLRIPCKSVKGKSDAHPVIVNNIAKQLKETGKNILPVMVQVLSEDKYEAVQNIQILQAAKQAKLDFVWCIVIKPEMLDLVRVEAGDIVRVPILTALEKEIAEVLEYLKVQKAGLKAINPKKAAKAIVVQREKTKIKSLSFLAKEKCGVGKAAIAKIKDSLVLE